MVEIKKYPHNTQLAEIGQAKHTRFAFLKKVEEDVYQEMHVPFLCKDFANELIQDNFKPGSMDWPIYNFNYDVKKYPLDTDVTRIIIKAPQSDIARIKEHLVVLHDLEDMAGFSNTKTISNGTNHIILESDRNYQRYLPYTSLYFLILRAFSYSVGVYASPNQFFQLVEDKKKHPDYPYLKTIREKGGMEWLFQNFNKIVEGTESPGGRNFINIRDIHNNGGIISVLDDNKSTYSKNIRKLKGEADPLVHNVFVYGTLKKGQPNHHILKHGEFVGKTTLDIKGKMINMGHYPAWVRGGKFKKRPLFGEIYRVNDDTLKLIDQVEGHPHFYKRSVEYAPQYGITIHVYTVPPKINGTTHHLKFKAIESGVWNGQ